MIARLPRVGVICARTNEFEVYCRAVGIRPLQGLHIREHRHLDGLRPSEIEIAVLRSGSAAIHARAVELGFSATYIPAMPRPDRCALCREPMPGQPYFGDLFGRPVRVVCDRCFEGNGGTDEENDV